MIDKPRFMQDFLRIATRGTEDSTGLSSLLQPLKINKSQRFYLENKTDRNVILKSRQSHGMSTIILADFFIDTITIPGLSAIVVSHGDLPTRRLLEKVKRFYNSCPEKNFFPEIYHDSDHLMSFPKLDSSFYIGTARAKIVGRGETPHRCHLSEFAFYNMTSEGRAEEILSEVGEAVPPKYGVLTIESTPYVRGDAFFNLYMGAKNGENNYKAFFFSWWMAEENNIKSEEVLGQFSQDKEENLKLTVEEEKLCTINGLNHDQIRWRRYKIRDLGHKFFREHPEDDQSCWLNPEAMVFDKDAIDRLLRIRVSPLEYRPYDFLTIWEMPMRNELYVIGADVAEGLPQGDFTAASIMKASNGTEVAAIRGMMPIDVCAGILAKVGKEYNYALLGVENSPHGVGILTMLENQKYPNLYWTIDGQGKPVKLGFTTSRISRPKMVDDFDMALRSGMFRTSNEQLLSECQGFIYLDGKPEAPKGEHSDALFAAMIAWQIREYANPISDLAPKADRYWDFD